ncbi:hypothetical protein DICA3_C02498 [Diutina catenulata]
MWNQLIFLALISLTVDAKSRSRRRKSKTRSSSSSSGSIYTTMGGSTYVTAKPAVITDYFEDDLDFADDYDLQPYVQNLYNAYNGKIPVTVFQALPAIERDPVSRDSFLSEVSKAASPKDRQDSPSSGLSPLQTTGSRTKTGGVGANGAGGYALGVLGAVAGILLL